MTIPSQNRFQIQNRFNGLSSLSKGIAKVFPYSQSGMPLSWNLQDLIFPGTPNLVTIQWSWNFSLLGHTHLPCDASHGFQASDGANIERKQFLSPFGWQHPMVFAIFGQKIDFCFNGLKCSFGSTDTWTEKEIWKKSF
jgi:hypothetical protein